MYVCPPTCLLNRSYKKKNYDPVAEKEQRVRGVFDSVADNYDLMNDLSVATKIVPNGYIMGTLRDAGARAAQNFLDRHFDRIGTGDSIDMRDMFS